MARLLLVLSLALVLVVTKGFSAQVDEPNRTDVVQVSDKTERMAADFRREVEQGRLREKTNGALNAIVRFAVYKLKQKGYKKEAAKLLSEWQGQWDGYLVRMDRDLGDHKPLSKWLAEKYDMLELILGADVCHMLRLDDIKIINFAIPVVFACVDNVDEAEYRKHFVPLAGTTIYWVSFFACVGGTWGTGFFFCGPISMGCEFLTENFVAPKLSPPAWKLACRPGVVLPEYIPQTYGGFDASLDN